MSEIPPPYRSIKHIKFSEKGGSQDICLTLLRNAEERPYDRVKDLSEVAALIESPLERHDLIALLLKMDGWVFTDRLIKTPSWLLRHPYSGPLDYAPAYLEQLFYIVKRFERRYSVSQLTENGFYCEKKQEAENGFS